MKLLKILEENPEGCTPEAPEQIVHYETVKYRIIPLSDRIQSMHSVIQNYDAYSRNMKVYDDL